MHIWYIFSACKCDVSGAIDNDCDGESGQCLCEKNWTGFNCNDCKKGYYKQSSKAIQKKCFLCLMKYKKKNIPKVWQIF